MADVKKVSILDLVVILLERKLIIIIAMAIVSIAAVITAMAITKKYTATGVVMPSKSKMPTGIGSLLGGDMPFNGLLKSLDMFGGAENDQFLSVLGSRRLGERVIEKFRLVERYKFAKKKKYFIEDVLKQYYRNLQINENDYSNIEVSFTDTSPTMAAEVVNYMVQQLDSISYELSRDAARYSRVFFESRIMSVKSDLDSAQWRFAEFQRAHNFIDLEEQVKATINALAGIEAQIMATDVQIEQLRNRFGPNSNKMAELLNDKAVYQNRIKKYMDQGSGQLVLPLKEAPRLAIEYGYLFHDAKVQETLYDFLVQLHEQAKFREIDNTPVVSVLEWAKPPQKKSQPKRMIICILFFVVGFAVVSIAVVLQKWYVVQKEHDTEAHRNIRLILSLLRFNKK
jgi:uncharacterized protein involved in exopolysaccharide biosynthesis